MAAIDIEKEFKHYLEIFTHDEELGKILAKVSFQELFNDKFLTENSKYTSMDDLIWRSGFGIMNLLEVEQVNQDKWNEYIAGFTCSIPGDIFVTFILVHLFYLQQIHDS